MKQKKKEKKGKKNMKKQKKKVSQALYGAAMVINFNY